jgi:glycolate oxidase FAD binding subunit
MEPALAQLAERIRAAAAAHEKLRIRAGGSKDFYGHTPHGAPLDPRAVSGVVSYQPTELALAVRCGTPLAEVETLLDSQQQMLAFEPPHFGAAATIGGCIACGLAGPRRAAAGYAYGGVRDFVLGAKLLDGRAQLLSFGGMVMKNVAGFDAARLLAGSLGTLGVIVEVALKVVPKQPVELTLQFDLDEATALRQLNTWGGQPLPLSASAWYDQTLWVRLSGSAAAVNAARKRLGGTPASEDAGSGLWRSLREQQHPFFEGATPLWRISLPPAAPPLNFEVPQLIEWGGALRWVGTRQPAAAIRERARQLGGHATLFRGGDHAAAVFTPLAPELLAIHRRLRTHFDPAGVFDGGRLYPELDRANSAG